MGARPLRILLAAGLLLTAASRPASAQLFSVPSLFAAIGRILVGDVDVVRSERGKRASGNDAGARFLQLGAKGPSSSPDDETLQRNALLFREGLELRKDALLSQAAKKRKLALRLRAAADRARGAEEELAKSMKAGNEIGYQRTEAKFQNCANRRRARVLEFEAKKLEEEATAIGATFELQDVAPKYVECDIMKIGPVKFAPLVDELQFLKDDTTMAQLAGDTLTVYYKKRPKLTYLMESVQIPIRNLPNSDSCLGFNYQGVEQVLCAADRVGRDSWINAITEAWFCRNAGVRAMMPSIEAEEKEVEKAEKATPPPTTETTTAGPLVDLDIGILKDGSPSFKIDGKEQYT